MKDKETLEEAAIEYSIDTQGYERESYVEAFIAGAKWMQEQMEKLKDFETWKEWKNR